MTYIAFPVLFFDASFELTTGFLNHCKHLILEVKNPCHFGRYGANTLIHVASLALLLGYTHSKNTSLSSDEHSFFYYFKLGEFVSFIFAFPAIYRLQQSFKTEEERSTSNALYQLLENIVNIINVIGFLPYVYLGTRLFDNAFLQAIIITCLPVYTSFINHNLEGPVKNTLKTASDLIAYISCFICEKKKWISMPKQKRTSPLLLLIRLLLSCAFYGPLFALMYFTSFASMVSAEDDAKNLNSIWISLIVAFAVAGNLTFSSHNLLHMGEPLFLLSDKKIRATPCMALLEKNDSKRTDSPMPPTCYSLFSKKTKKTKVAPPTDHWLKLFSRTCKPRQSRCCDVTESLFLYLMLGLSASALRTTFYMLSELFLGLRDYNPNHFSWLGEFISNLVSLTCTFFFFNKLNCAKNYHFESSKKRNLHFEPSPHSSPLLVSLNHESAEEPQEILTEP